MSFFFKLLIVYTIIMLSHPIVLYYSSSVQKYIFLVPLISLERVNLEQLAETKYRSMFLLAVQKFGLCLH